MAFYAGKWLVEEVPVLDALDWCFPDTPNDSIDQHVKETQNIQELRITPEDLSFLPVEVQAGGDSWEQITFIVTDTFYREHSPQVGGWYNVSAVLDLTGFYIIPDDC